jgi:arsenate reductase (thioredoxin)
MSDVEQRAAEHPSDSQDHNMKRVLILCTGNSCRSQMAEALWNNLGQGKWQAFSAGLKPAGYVHPLALQVMSESGFDLSQNRSKHLDEFLDEPFDLVVTVCDNAKAACPVLPGAKQVLHWPFDDPAHAGGTKAEKLVVFRSVRDQIRTRISEYLEGIPETGAGD